MTSDDFFAGRQAFVFCFPRSACPFDIDSDDDHVAERAQAWLRGWDEAKAEAQETIEEEGELVAMYD